MNFIPEVTVFYIIHFIMIQCSGNSGKEKGCIGKAIARSEQTHLHKNYRKKSFSMLSRASTNGTGTGNWEGRKGKPH